MNNKITESAIEKLAIEVLEKQGYQYIHGPDIAPDSKKAERASYEDVILLEKLKTSVTRINPLIPAEVIEELIKLSKEIREMDKEPKEMGLSDYEYAFYTAIANNDSAKEVMEQGELRELAVVLFEKVKENASIDWTIKESVKAKLKVIVKRILRKYGYPLDMQMLAIETELKQAELIAEELTNDK